MPPHQRPLHGGRGAGSLCPGRGVPGPPPCPPDGGGRDALPFPSSSGGDTTAHCADGGQRTVSAIRPPPRDTGGLVLGGAWRERVLRVPAPSCAWVAQHWQSQWPGNKVALEARGRASRGPQASWLPGPRGSPGLTRSPGLTGPQASRGPRASWVPGPHAVPEPTPRPRQRSSPEKHSAWRPRGPRAGSAVRAKRLSRGNYPSNKFDTKS